MTEKKSGVGNYGPCLDCFTFAHHVKGRHISLTYSNKGFLPEIKKCVISISSFHTNPLIQPGVISTTGNIVLFRWVYKKQKYITYFYCYEVFVTSATTTFASKVQHFASKSTQRCHFSKKFKYTS